MADSELTAPRIQRRQQALTGPDAQIDCAATGPFPRSVQAQRMAVGPNAAQTQFSVKIGQFDKGDHTVYAVLVREKNGEPETYQDSQRISVRWRAGRGAGMGIRSGIIRR